MKLKSQKKLTTAKILFKKRITKIEIKIKEVCIPKKIIVHKKIL